MHDIIRSDRLTLRRWSRDDAALLLDAIHSSINDLRRFTPWVIPEPPELETLGARLAGFRAQFDAGVNWIYGILDNTAPRVLGQIGVYARVGPDALELGYFVRSDAAGRGYATEAARALIEAAFRDRGVSRMEIRCEPDNVASVAIARKCGFTLRETRVEESGKPLMVWERHATPHAPAGVPGAG